MAFPGRPGGVTAGLRREQPWRLISSNFFVPPLPASGRGVGGEGGGGEARESTPELPHPFSHPLRSALADPLRFGRLAGSRTHCQTVRANSLAVPRWPSRKLDGFRVSGAAPHPQPLSPKRGEGSRRVGGFGKIIKLPIDSSASAKGWGSWRVERLLAGQHWLSKGESRL